jgi:hypothetical protein
VVLSLHGAGIVSNHKLPAAQEMILRSVESNRDAEVRVTGETGPENGHFTYGVRSSTTTWISGRWISRIDIVARWIGIQDEECLCDFDRSDDCGAVSLESPNAPAIYMPARVANIAELPGAGWRFLPWAGTRAHSRKNWPAA